MDRLKKHLKFVLKLLVSLAGISYIFYRIPFSEIRANWTSHTLAWLLFLIFITFLSMLIQANRWRGLLLDEGKKIPFRTFYAYIALGYFFTAFLPGGFGGDIVKTIAFGRRFNQTPRAVAAILVSRVQGLLMLFLLFFFSLPWVLLHYSLPKIYVVCMSVALLISIAAIIACCFSDRIPLPRFLQERFPFVEKLAQALALYRGHRRQFLLSFLDSFWVQLIVFVTSFGYFMSVGIDIDFRTVVVFSAITIIATMLPISLNGIGVREWILVSLYAGVLGIPADRVLAGNLLGYILILFQAVQGAAVLIWLRKKS